MKTSAKLIVRCLAVGFGVTIPTFAQANQSLTLQVVLGSASLGQAAASPAKEAEELLSFARKAIGEGNFEIADSYIARAERLNPQYSPYYRGDTPAKVREELARHVPPPVATPRSAQFGNREAARDPFAGYPSTSTPAGPGAANTVQDAYRLTPRDANTAVGGSNPMRGPTNVAMVDPRGVQQPQNFNGVEPAIAGPMGNAPGILPAAGGQPMEPAANPMRGPDRRTQAVELARQARAALVRGDDAQAEMLARQSQSLAPDSAFGPGDERPGMVLLDIHKMRQGVGRGPVVQAAGTGSADLTVRSGVVQSGYDAGADRSRNVQVTATQPMAPGRATLAQATLPVNPLAPDGGPARPISPGADQGMSAAQLMEQGERALTDKDTAGALRYFQQAYQKQQELDPRLRDRLQNHMQILSRPAAPMRQPQPNDLLEGVTVNQKMLSRQVASDVSRMQTAARGMTEKEPKRALEMLKQLRANVAAANLEVNDRDHQLRRLDMTINQTEQYIKANASQIELDEQNHEVEQQVKQGQEKSIEVDDKMKALVDEFNKLVEEQRFAEAELVAKRAAALDPDNLVVTSLLINGRVLNRMYQQQVINDAKEGGFIDEMINIDRAAVPFPGNIEFPNIREWQQLSTNRGQRLAEQGRRRTDVEKQIEQKLSTPVELNVDRKPLNEVVADLRKLAGINILLDPTGLAAEGVSAETPITFDLSNAIPMKSYLNLILEPLRLSYIIQDNVLKITSVEMTKGVVYQQTYQVADLVIPIPNFVPNGNMGIEAALSSGYQRAGYGTPAGGFGAGSPTVMLANDTPGLNRSVHAQMMNNGTGGGPSTGIPQQVPFGPGGMGGGSQADFDALIELIEETIAPTTWAAQGGNGAMREYENNLSLIVTQTDEVHEQIADLLTQLRSLQDLQVTIEVRFITLTDNFFERIGVDFDFTIDSNITPPSQVGSSNGPSQVIGLDALGLPTANLDLQFNQGSFVSGTVPSFPGIGFDPATAGTFGFAILSDIEAFFLIQAAQGDSRSNILQAPKVTLFNGQQAFISDTSQRPFVTSIVPVVGDFAAAQQPVIVVLSEGTSLTVQAVVSSDRRFVRLTVVPFFSQIGDVEEFTFTGSTTTTTKSSESKSDDVDSTDDEETAFSEGTTVQLPTFSFVTVTTTVSVPDGGTVLLGGIKRLSEGRNERGIPILSKLPYINRLFKNVGIGRTTTSLMLMVTPRIIIQEEEEAKLTGVQP
ncbi:MAG: hypothetical protein SGJ20_07435 [Planctomycetota bacterium]|nr:hypothetical protein [Planctomycetota bacterium]